ncbi:hypothetical protein Syun_022981 [Stephania yunnanensis]|uniref:Uncharacterized protein n=1 Tax=Stephania yunnanensis TaxID=152371 RepID=A0AAP0FAG4_9MAGN
MALIDSLSSEDTISRVKLQEGVDQTVDSVLGKEFGNPNGIEASRDVVCKESLLTTNANVFHTPISLEDGDMVINRDDIGPYVTISKRLQDLMDKQMENTLIVKLMVKLTADCDMEKALFRGPWVILGHVLSVQKRYSEFRVSDAVITKAAL